EIIDISDLNLIVGHPNGTLAKIKYVSNLKLSENVVLFDALVVPEYCVSLLSVNKLIKDNRMLGHPSNQVVDVLRHDLNFTKDSQVSSCDICHKAKQTRESLPFSDHQTIIIGEIVHLDLWGPYKVISKDGFGYFLTIVDDYTRVVWVYLVKTKDEVYDLFVS
ncbi:ribonuclease H-like domain-containing protein, partial [Tanacetum coccineum]